MDPLGYGMVLQRERDRITERVNRQAWMIETVDERSQHKVREAFMRRILRAGE